MADLAQVLEVGLQVVAVWYQRVHHLRPRAVQRLVPDRRLVARDGKRVRLCLNDGGALGERLGGLPRGHEVHLMDEAAHTGVRRVFKKCLDYRIKVTKLVQNVYLRIHFYLPYG